MKAYKSFRKAIAIAVWLWILCSGPVTCIHAAGQSCPYITIKPPMDVEINHKPPYCLYSRWHRLGYYWLLAIPVSRAQGEFLWENIWTSQPPIKEGQWNEVGCCLYYPAKDLLILASDVDGWFDRNTQIRIHGLDSRSFAKLKPFPIPNDVVWKQVQQLSPGSKFDIFGTEPDCTAWELQDRRFVGSTEGDFNGDGKQDIAFHTTDRSGHTTFWIFHSAGDGFELVLRRKGEAGWIGTGGRKDGKGDCIVLVGGCEKGDSQTLEYDEKTRKYILIPHPDDHLSKPIPFE